MEQTLMQGNAQFHNPSCYRKMLLYFLIETHGDCI